MKIHIYMYLNGNKFSTAAKIPHKAGLSATISWLNRRRLVA
nr:MAG TPA_asm: hypothetical protein [Caudoviricetes sp.]